MKRKIILLILIIIIGIFAWRLFSSTFSSEPIEIIPETSENLPTDEKKISGISDTLENLENKPKEEDISLEESEKTDLKIEEITVKKETKEPEKVAPKEEIISEQENSSDFIINKKVSWGYSSSSGRTIDTIVIHSSYDALGSEPYDVDGLIDEYKEYSVAPHYLIDRKGKVYRLVDDKNIAYHAGASKTPDERTGVNNFSIGIEMMNTQKDDYTSQQYSSLNDLIDYLESQYKIKYVLGHEDISPDRKTDPWNFEWKEVESKNSIH